jgi:hypothetical protein
MRLLLEMPLDSNRWMLGSSLARGNRHRAPDADPASQCVKAATSCALSRCPAASSHRPKSGIGPAKRKQCTLPRDPIQSRHCVLHNAHRALSSHHTKQYLRVHQHDIPACIRHQYRCWIRGFTRDLRKSLLSYICAAAGLPVNRVGRMGLLWRGNAALCLMLTLRQSAHERC